MSSRPSSAGLRSPRVTSPTPSGSSARPAPSKRRANDLLRNYYGLGDATSPSLVSTSAHRTDPDSINFDAQAAFQALLQEKNLPQLLRAESHLLTEIRELDGERQSLVYNHHHELVSASETIGKMKTQAESLSPNLISLRSSLGDISEGIRTISVAPTDQHPSSQISARDLAARSSKTSSSGQSIRLADLQKYIAHAIELPSRMKDIILLDTEGKGLEKARGVWGSMEAVLATWDEAGIPGAKDIMNECRHVLREAQQQGR